VYELNSTLNDPEGVWIAHHSTNRYRDWDELRYSIRSLEKYTGPWRNTIQLLVNSVPDEDGKLERQTPTWLNNHAKTRKDVKVISLEELFDEDKQPCLPTFNSLTIENQIFNINSTSDHVRYLRVGHRTLLTSLSALYALGRHAAGKTSRRI
jgi:Stealth protein CR2, conserved region 2